MCLAPETPEVKPSGAAVDRRWSSFDKNYNRFVISKLIQCYLFLKCLHASAGKDPPSVFISFSLPLRLTLHVNYLSPLFTLRLSVILVHED